MIEKSINPKPDTNHNALAALIPWYVNGTLSGAEKIAVEQHIALCKQCQNEVTKCQHLTAKLPSEETIWKPSQKHFASILANLDTMEAVSVKSDNSQIATARGFFQRLVDGVSATPGPIRWVLAIESMACVGLLLFVVLLQKPLQPPLADFETLADADVSMSAKSSAIRLFFSEDMTIRELMELLKQAKAQIRQGPSEVGSYTVEVPASEVAQSITFLRQHAKVRLAQPLDKPLSAS
jgi:Putative zinc-finger